MSLHKLLLRVYIYSKEKKAFRYFYSRTKDECAKLESIKPRIIDNFDELQNELEETEKDIEQFEEEVYSLRSQISKEKMQQF